jgi:hypothetical protein
MAPMGFSTGSLALGDFRLGLQLVEGQPAAAIELSALREEELMPLVDALDDLDLSQFSYVAVHAPSRIHRLSEEMVVECLVPVWTRGWSIVVHPDTIVKPELWTRFGALACIENMDKRKRTGRTTAELLRLFAGLPQASLCFDLGHARQVDPTMCEAELMLTTFKDRIRQVHISAVSSESAHEQLDYEAMIAFQQVARLIPADTPIILETPVSRNGVVAELRRAETALCRR